MEGTIKMADTIFTKIINHEIPSEIVYHDDLVTAFKDIAPKAEHHILIVTNKPIPSVSDVEPEDEAMLGHLFIVAKKIATDLGVKDSGYRLIVNCGPDGGQEPRSPSHPHALISRWQVRRLRLPTEVKARFCWSKGPCDIRP